MYDFFSLVFSSLNLLKTSFSTANIWTIFIPLTCSEINAFTPAILLLIDLYISLVFFLKITVNNIIKGITVKVIKDNLRLYTTIVTIIPTKTKMLFIEFTITLVYSSFNVSVSLVTLVTSFPIGFLLKNSIDKD